MTRHANADICEPGNGITLGAGWSEAAWADDQPFRTIAAEATFEVAGTLRSSYIVALTVEPADYETIPGIKISSSAGVLADVPVHGRQIVRAMVPHAVTLDAVTIATSGTKPGGPAIRVLSIMAHRSFGEIVLESEHLRLGANWYPLEIFNGRAFRWAANDVSLYADAGFAAKELIFDVETGPSAPKVGLRLELRDESGTVLASGEARGLARLRFDTGSVVAPAKLTMVAEGGGSSSTGDDDRVLNYRVFDIAVAALPTAK